MHCLAHCLLDALPWFFESAVNASYSILVLWHVVVAPCNAALSACTAFCSLEAFSVLMNEAAELLVRKLDAAAKAELPVDIHKLLGEMTMGVVGTTAFGFGPLQSACQALPLRKCYMTDRPGTPFGVSIVGSPRQRHVCFRGAAFLCRLLFMYVKKCMQLMCICAADHPGCGVSGWTSTARRATMQTPRARRRMRTACAMRPASSLEMVRSCSTKE